MREKLEQRFPIKSFLNKHIWSYQVPATLNFWYAFGLIAVLLIINQFISGLWLVMFYIPTIERAFASVQELMHQISAGWFIRYLHTTGASFLFICLYLHIIRAFRYGSYRQPREVVWVLGTLLWFLLMLEAFLGYVLPWGQMSYWGAEVATSALDGIPWIGEVIKYWLRGAQQVGQPLLQRCYALHIILVPFLIFIIIKLHIVAIRCVGSSEPIEVEQPSKKILFIPHHLVKELVPIGIFFCLFFAAIFFFPSGGGLFIEGINQMPADPLQTPANIHPPWYLTPYFAILRSIPNLGMGLFFATMALVMIMFLPLLDKSKQRILKLKSKINRYLVYMFGLDFLLLGGLGWYEVNDGRIIIARMATLFYFAFFLLMPWYSKQDR